MTVMLGEDLGVPLPPVTEKERGGAITVAFDGLDKRVGLVLRAFPVVDRLNKPTPWQDIHKGPAIPPIVTLALVCR